MKKLFITMLSIVAILCTTACSDEKFATETEGEEMIEFTVQLSDGVDASRAISDGLTVEELYCEVYSMADPANPQRLTDLDQKVEKMGTTVNKDGLTVKTATIRMALVKGQAYNVLFWAQAPGAYNLIDANTNKTDLRNITVAPATANTESKDAFTAVYKTVKVTGPIKETIVLTRPFAQINFGTTVQDYEDALKAGIDFGAASKELVDSTLVSKIVASHGATIYDALTETSVDDGQGLTFGWAEVKEMVENEKLMVGGVEYKYLATAYMLVPGGYESNVSDIEMEIETGLNENITLAVPFAPVQRNYRTNVLGNLLTNTADFTIIVDPIYNTPDNNIEVDKTETVSTAAELQAAIDAAIVGNNIITFGADITGDIIVPQNEGINIVINGAGYEFDGTFDIYGKARFQGAETLTFSDIDFVHADGAIDFISCNTTESEKRYAHNVIVSNCTFTGNANGDVVGMRYRQCYNMTVLNSTFTDMHSVMWATGGDGNGVTIDGVTAVNCKNGASFGTTNNVVVKNSNITTVGEYGYGLRANASGAYKMSVENTTINAAAPILAREATGAYTLALEGNNTLNTTAAYQIIVTNSDYDAGKVLEAPTGAYTLTGAEGFVVYPRDRVAVSQEDLATALKDTSVQSIYLKAGEFTADIYSIPERETLNIVGTEGTKLAFANLQVRASQFKEFTVSNCEILRMPNKAWGMLVFGSGNKADGVYTISNCTFNGVGTQGIYINENVSGATYNILDCTFNGDFGGEGAVTIQNNENVNHNVNVTGCTFNNVPATSHKMYILYAYEGWTLNTDLNEADIFWKAK